MYYDFSAQILQLNLIFSKNNKLWKAINHVLQLLLFVSVLKI